MSAGADERPQRLDPTQLDGYRELRVIGAAAAELGIADPFFRVHDGIAGAESTIDGRRISNFASYDYLGLNGDPRVVEAAKAAIDRYGTTVSASRMVSGERGIHRELESELARLYAAEDAVALVGGHATNVSLIGALLGPGDVIVYDALAHNSIVEGARLSGARRMPFRHLDPHAAEKALAEARPRHAKALIVIEGHYSMDGDAPDLAAFVAVARRHRAWLMVDEAHALGVLGHRGFGLAEHVGIDPGEVDIWMGTLSKSLVSTGGYIAGSGALIGYLKHTLPGFVFSVGIAPPLAAAALAALRILRDEPERVTCLNRNAALFAGLLREAGLDIGGSIGAAIVPLIIGSSIGAGRLAQALFARGINAPPILYPAVRAARLRFFVTAGHSEAQLRETARIVIEEAGALR
ncbi:MAG TPA: aminotransferase class I/II-fold pyridoxal phosphate-dependent enzyme [Stellaceae bacterium]|nr:aminotransferase class I/II-fold pyridoxal phosphate-dependent enzyme [Stellaceae bacterium]